MEKRDVTDFVIVHHSATARDTTTTESIKKYHIDHNGWDNIGYHKVIEGDGSIHTGMPINMVGYHCLYGDLNYKSVGICLTGNFQEERPSGAQLKSLEEVLKEWEEKYDIPRDKILGHKKTGAATSCPGDNLVSWLEKYRAGGTVGEYLALDEDISAEIEEKYNLKELNWYSKYWTGHEFIREALEYAKKLEENVESLEKDLSGYSESDEEYAKRIEVLLQDKEGLKVELVASRDTEVRLLERIREMDRNYAELKENYAKEVKELGEQRDKCQKDSAKFKADVEMQNAEYENTIEGLRIIKEEGGAEVDKNILWESVKDPLRVIILGIIPFALAYLIELPYEWAAIATLVLKGLDKYLHNVGKDMENETLITGLTRF